MADGHHDGERDDQPEDGEGSAISAFVARPTLGSLSPSSVGNLVGEHGDQHVAVTPAHLEGMSGEEEGTPE
jgi:hypothetical protein